MKNLFLITLSLFFAGLAIAHDPSTEMHKSFEIDTELSKVIWDAEKVTGQHTGEVKIKNGSMTIHGSGVVGTAVNIDMTTISCTDIEDEKYNQKLVGHLKSDDFFSVEANPVSNFSATSIKAIPDAKTGENNYTITGNLTIKGITNEISFPAYIDVQAGQIMANGTATFDRSKWDIRYGSGSFFEGLGDKAIFDDVKITFILVAKA